MGRGGGVWKDHVLGETRKILMARGANPMKDFYHHKPQASLLNTAMPNAGILGKGKGDRNPHLGQHRAEIRGKWSKVLHE